MRWLHFGAGMLMALSACSASAFSYIMMKDNDLRDQAAQVVTARVDADLGGFRTRAGIETRYRLRVESVLKGRIRAQSVVLALPGGALDSGVGELAYGIPRLKTGERVLVFLAARQDRIYQAVQLSLGLFFEQQVHGQRLYVRYLDSDDDLSSGKNAAYHRVRDAALFEHWLRQSQGKSVTPDYFVDVSYAISAQAKFNHFRDGNDNQPVRWFQFDSDTALLWKSTSASDPSITSNRFTMLSNAANAITNDPGSRLTVTHNSETIAGTDTHCDDGSSDGHTVLWNDPLGTISGSFSCASGGTLATGGPCYFVNLQTSNSVSYHPAFEGRITVQNGVGCVFDNNSGADGAEVMLHEMGHVIGLGHSCEFDLGQCTPGSAADNATMRSRAHQDGRGATWQTDDLVGLAFIYPAPAVPPSLSVSDVSVTEGNSGTVNATFTVTLSAATNQAVTFNFATADNTATLANLDYVLASGNRNIAAGQTSTTINVTVNGDTAIEPNESFFINITNVVNAIVLDAQATGTITNDDVPPTLSINDVSVIEGNVGTKLMTFTVSLSAASNQLVTTNFATANGTATTANSDYVSASGLASLPAGQLTTSVNVTINGDTTGEPDETLLVNLSNPSNATLADGQGLGTILDDDNRIYANGFE